MCEPASMIVTKKTIYWSEKTESHHNIIKEFNLKEQDVRGNYTLVPIEIKPPNRDYKLPLSKWVFQIDIACYQRDLPEWWDAKKAEKRVRMELKKWRNAKLVMPSETINFIETGQKIANYGTIGSVKGGTIEHVNGGTIKSVKGGTIGYVRGGTIEYVNGGTIEYVGGGTIEHVVGGTIESVKGGTIKYVKGGTIGYVGGGTIKSVDGGTIGYVGGGTIEYVVGGTIEHVGGGTIKSVDGGTIGYVRGKFPDSITGNPIIINYSALSRDILKSTKAVLIDRTNDPVVCYVGKK